MSFKMGSFYKLHRDLWNPPGDNNRTFVVSLDYQIHNQECMHMLTKTSAPLRLASHAGVFRGARLSSLGRDEKRAPLKTPAWEATLRPL